jgi:methyl-accepting chemotaxis protein
MSDDKRKKVRRTLRIRAILLCGDDMPDLMCTLVDISETGARLAIEEVNEVPDEFTIAFTANGTPSRKCRLVWRGEADVGVAFEMERPKPVGPKCLLQPGVSREEAVSAFGLHS